MNYNWNWGIFFQASPDGTGTYADMLLSGLMWTWDCPGLVDTENAFA